MPSLLTVPREPLARFRLLALWFALLVMFGNAIGIPIVNDLPLAKTIAASVASVLLGAWWAYGHRRGGFAMIGWLVEPVLITLVAAASPLPMRALGAFFAGVQLRALYLSRRELPLLIVTYAIARLASIALALTPGPFDIVSSTTVFQIVALSVIAAILHAFVVSLERQSLAEKALIRSDERYRLLASATRDVFYDYDLSTGHIEWSESMLSVFGYYPAEVGPDVNWWLAHVHPDDRAGFQETVRTFLTDPARRIDTFHYRLARADGTYAYVSANALLQRDPDGTAVRIIGAVRDVTVESQLAEQLRQSQKMEAIGQLAGGMAHDFNNLLTVIGGHVYMLEHKLQPNAAVEQHLKGIGKTVDRAAALTRQLLAFSRRQLMKPSVVNINAVVDDAVQMIRPALAENIAFEMALDPLVSPALADPGQLTQVLLNLALNARDAMPHGGTLTIETGNITMRDGSGDALSSALPAGDYVRLVVRDTGIGMSPTTLARAFEPFFTTKPPGTGTGLGLAMAYGIIKQSLGDIRAESVPGHGSSFTVLLPAARSSVEVTAAQAELPAAPLGDGEHVLLVEDDDGVRDFAREVLKRAGYVVHEARDGADGLDVAKPILGDIAIVVTDMIMPRMGGRDMVTRLRLQRPDLRVLYMTGYTDDSGLIGELRGSDAELLEKPFGASALVRAAARAAKATPA